MALSERVEGPGHLDDVAVRGMLGGGTGRVSERMKMDFQDFFFFWRETSMTSVVCQLNPDVSSFGRGRPGGPCGGYGWRGPGELVDPVGG